MSEMSEMSEMKKGNELDKKNEMICIGCPMGCVLTVTEENGDWSVTGNQCKIGEKYGKEEMIRPTRHITTSVRITGGDMPLLSVKTAQPIPKAAIMDCMQAIRSVTVAAPVYIGTVVLQDVAGTGVDMVATRTVEAVPIKETASTTPAKDCECAL